jgi:hypothetical protein
MENGNILHFGSRSTEDIVDISSYEKELENQTHSDGILPLNLVATILAHGVDGRQFTTPLEAKLFLREEIERYEEILHGALSVALSDMDNKGVEKSDHRRRWLYILPYIVSGNIWFGQSVSLYMYFGDVDANVPISADSPLQPSGETGVEKDYSS